MGIAAASLIAAQFSVVIGSAAIIGGQLQVHGTVDGQPIDTYPPDPAPLLALGDPAAQQAYLSDLLIAAAQSYPPVLDLTALASDPAVPLVVVNPALATD